MLTFARAFAILKDHHRGRTACMVLSSSSGIFIAVISDVSIGISCEINIVKMKRWFLRTNVNVSLSVIGIGAQIEWYLHCSDITNKTHRLCLRLASCEKMISSILQISPNLGNNHVNLFSIM